MDEKGFVLWLHQHLIEKTAAGVALRLKDGGLTAAGVNQQSQRERKVSVLRKILDGLRSAVFLQREIVFGKIADNFAMFVADGDRQGNHLDVNGDGSRGFLSPYLYPWANSRNHTQRRDQQVSEWLTQNRLAWE